MKTLVKFFIENAKLTIILTFGMAVLGGMGLKQLNSESYPSVDFAMATVTTFYDGATPEDIETKITKPIEDEIRTVDGLKDVRSVSQSGLSTIYVRADMDNVDVEKVMSDLQKAVDRVTDLPNDLREKPKFKEVKSEEFPVMEIAIIGPNDQRQRDILADLLKEDIEDNKKVLEVRLTGFRERKFQINLEPAKLALHHIGVDEVLNKISLRNINVPGGSLKDNSFQQLLRVEGKIKNKAEIENIVIRSNFDGQRILLKDLAIVEDSKEDAVVFARYNGEQATLATVTKKAGADTIALVNEIDYKIEDYQKRYEKDFKIFIYNNEALKVKNRLEVLTSNAVSGLILVIVFLFIFLPGKIGLVASMSLPLAVMATFGFMPMFGMNLNAITILALVIALGMLVDNSVVISENFARLRSEGMSPMDAAQTTIAQLWLPITSTAFTTIAAFLPMLVTKGVMGEFIKWIPVVVTISLLLSLGESFFFLPMRLLWAGKSFKQGSQTVQKEDWFQKFIDKFEAMMRVLVKNRYKVFVGFLAILIGSGALMVKGNTFILFPPDQTEIYIARVETENGSKLEHTEQKVANVIKQIKEALGDDALHIVGRAGVSQAGLSDPKSKDGNNVGMAIIYVSDYAKFNRPHTEILGILRKIQIEDKVDVTFEAQVNGPPVGDPVNATFRSNNGDNLVAVVSKVMEKLKATEGVVDVKVDDVIGDDEVFVDIDYQKAAQLGLNVSTIGDTVRTAVSGKIISKVTLNNKEVDLNVRLLGPYRQNIDDLKTLKVMDSRGNLIPLDKIANFRVEAGTPQIKRFDYKRSKTVTADVNSEVINAVQANKVVQEVYDELKVQYPDVNLVFGGEQESTNESMESLFSALILSLIGIFALLVFLFKSYLRPAIIMSTIPLGLVGFSIAFYFHDRPIGFLALIGIIALGGIIVNAGIVLISFIDQMREEGNMELEQILARASGLRLRAVLVTSLTTISGLIPTAYGIGGTDAILVPMTLAMAWGLTSGTILTLVWVPCAYAILEDFTMLMDRILAKFKSGDDQETSSKDEGEDVDELESPMIQ